MYKFVGALGSQEKYAKILVTLRYILMYLSFVFFGRQ